MPACALPPLTNLIMDHVHSNLMCEMINCAHGCVLTLNNVLMNMYTYGDLRLFSAPFSAMFLPRGLLW